MARIKIPEDGTNDEQVAAQKFITMTKGMTAYQVATVMNSITPGMDWKGCGKFDIITILRSDASRGKPFDYELLKEKLSNVK